MSFLSVCKNVIAENNKRGWCDPQPAIRMSNSRSGKVTGRGHVIGITDAAGNIVARIVSTTDGKPVISCGAKVAIITEHDAMILDEETKI